MVSSWFASAIKMGERSTPISTEVEHDNSIGWGVRSANWLFRLLKMGEQTKRMALLKAFITVTEDGNSDKVMIVEMTARRRRGWVDGDKSDCLMSKRTWHCSDEAMFMTDGQGVVFWKDDWTEHWQENNRQLCELLLSITTKMSKKVDLITVIPHHWRDCCCPKHDQVVVVS